MRIGPVLTWFSSSGVEAHMVVNETFEPWGICCNDNDDIIVTDHNNHKVLVSFTLRFSLSVFTSIINNVQEVDLAKFFVGCALSCK